MRKAMRWIGGIVAGLLVLVLLSWGLSRLLGPDRESREALSLIQQSWDPPGENAFDAVWLLPYAVPEDRVHAIAAADMQRMHAAPPAVSDGHGGLWGFTSLAAETFAEERLAPEDQGLLCDTRGEPCLAKVRGNLAAYEGLVDRHAGLLQRHDALARHGHIRNLLPPRIDAPFPSFGAGRLAYTRNAVLFARGDVDAALESTCRDLATWRRLGAQSDMLIATMVGIAYSTGSNGALLAEMLGELPAGHPLPPSCHDAVRPPEPEELSMCRAMRGEFAFTTQAVELAPEIMKTESRVAVRLLLPLLLNEEKTKARAASTYAAYCSDASMARIVADRPSVTEDMPGLDYLEFGCIDNAIGCILSAIAVPALPDYQNRLLDHGARLRLLGTLLWLHGDAAGQANTLQVRLADRPQGLKGAARDVEVGEGSRTLRIRQYSSRDGDYWEVPLPVLAEGESTAD